MRPILFFVFVSFLMTACGPNYIYEETIDLHQAGWRYKDSLQADFVIEDTTIVYNLLLELEHSTVFPFQNFYTKIHTTFPSGERISQQVSLEIMNKVGQWHGSCNGETCLLELPIQEGAFFSQPGEYQITIEQFSRLNPLPEIHSLSFKLEDTGARR